ncbi:hypothetical protein OUZ56_022118 [Daphnia magna]|uniref:GMP synthase n=1 Tax=Daphnia magna TaxID=35525 RepID=A0ABR0AVJ0_9CRUS|nr:hypothetical protein OUZ56_022118 [Daphnia magna]
MVFSLSMLIANWKYSSFSQNFTMFMNNRNVVVVIRERYANRVSLFSIRNRNGFEEDIDGVLYMFVGRAQKSSGSFYYRTCYGNPFGFDSAVCAALFHKALLQSDDSSRVHDIHIDNGFLRKDESEQVVTSLQQLGLNLRSSFPDTRLTFYDASTNVHGRQTLSLCRTVNPEDKRRIIGDMFVKEEHGLASTFFISVSLIYPFCFKEILEAPDVFHWHWSHSVTEVNATNVMLSVIANNVGLVRRQVRADTVTESITGNAHPQESATASTKRGPYWCIA